MKIKTGKPLALIIVMCFIAMAVAGCTPQGGQEPGGEAGEYTPDLNENGHDLNSIVRWSYDWPTYADPGVGSSGSCSMVHPNLYSPLVWPGDDGTMKPHVAESWTISDDGTTYTFKIRQGIKFHSGNILTAKDVAWSMNRLLTIGEGYSYLFNGIVKSCEAPDDETVVIRLEEPFAPFIGTLPRLYVLDSELVMQHLDMNADTTYGEYGDYGKAWLLANDAGSGPYCMIDPQLESYVKGEKFDDWFMGWDEDAPDFFMLTSQCDPVAIRTAFANEEMELSVGAIPQETVAELRNMGMNVYTTRGVGTWNIMLNTRIAPTDDVNFRKALASAFDYDTMVNSIFPGNDKCAGPIVDGMFGKNENLEGYKYDLDLAREYLAKSKYANDPSSWVVELAWCAEVPEQEKISLMWQAACKELGVTVNITKTPFSVMSANAQKIETTPHASIVLWSPTYLEAGDVFSSRYHSKSTGSWEQMEWLLDEELDAMIDASLSITDDAQRAEAYAEIEEYIYELCPTIWMCNANGNSICQPYIEWDYAEASHAGQVSPLPGGYATVAADLRIHPEMRKR
ncbi:MAG: ABC transporter substrate-binding protein [Bacillota bacterium]